MGIHDLITGKTATETFDAILLCTGHHADKHTPHFEGEETFKGTRVHANDYRDYHGFESKKVVIIGIGNSGGDIAVELGKSHSEVIPLIGMLIYYLGIENAYEMLFSWRLWQNDSSRFL